MFLFKATKSILLMIFLHLIFTQNALSSDLTVNIADSGVVIIKNKNKTINIKTNTFITGYSVNCLANRFIAWGHPKKINKNNPQDSVIILYDIVKGKNIGEKGLSKGIFGVEYLTNSNKAYIDSDPGSIIDTNTGNIVTAEPDYYSQYNEIFEKCTKDKSWEFNRYPQE